MSLASFMMRYYAARGDKKRDAGLVPPESLVLHRNIPYGPHKKQKLDVYLPRDGEQPLDVIVSVHGGGWVYGDKELYSHYCMNLAARGYGVVNFTYRLSPEHKFPCHLEDTVLAFQWVLDHGTEYGLNTQNIFAVGDSAGGHLLALYCCLCTNESYARAYPFGPRKGFVPRAVALNCGVYDLVAAKGTGSGIDSLTKDVLGHRASHQELWAISPVFHIEKGFPPCYVMTSNEDFLKAQPDSLLPVLEEKQIVHEFHCCGDETTRLGHVFHLDIRSGPAIACNDQQCRFFARHRVKNN